MNEHEQEMFVAGSEVRLKHDPGRRGFLTGKIREQAGTRLYQVGFPDGKSFQPEYELEIVRDADTDPDELLAKKRFGRAKDLRRQLTYVQLSGKLANLIYSMDTTHTEFLAYQFKPVLSFLESPAGGILIADEVGLGKTIEAGLVWTELRARFDARRLVVVCPAMLREKWCDELRRRFAVDARIANAGEFLSALKVRKDEIPDGQGIVCSMQGLRPPSNWDSDDENLSGSRHELARFLRDQVEEEPLIDLLIIDEAHYLRNPESQTSKLGHMLRRVSQNIVLLSATPINLRDDDLFYLLNLVDPDSFDVKEVFPQVLRANEPLQRARLKALDMGASWKDIQEILNEAQMHPLLSDNRQLQYLLHEFDASSLDERAERVRLANRIEKINLLGHALNRTRKVEVTEWKVVRDPFTHFVALPPDGPERILYDNVTEAVRRYALASDISEGFLLATPQRQMSSCMYAAVESWRSRGGDVVEQVYEDLGVETDKVADISPLVDYIRQTVLPAVDPSKLWKNDSKYKHFYTELQRYLNENPTEKVVIFSYFRATLKYLCKRLHEDGIKSRVLIGGMQETKQSVIDEFREDAECRVLLSSEVASEGVDLQFCRVLINYDLPWNPMKIEQRIGRIDRIGQQADKISIWNLGYKDTIDDRIYQRLFLRLGIFERALGGMEAILGEQISELTADLLRNELTPEQEQKRIDDTALAIERIREENEELEKQASHLIAHAGYIMERIKSARQFSHHITSQDLVTYVKDYLDRYAEGHKLQQVDTEELTFTLKLPPRIAGRLDDFIRRKKLHGQTRLSGGDEVTCKFLNKLRNPFERYECISQFHPLVRFISDDLKQKDEAFFPLVAIELDSRYLGDIALAQYPAGIYAFVVKKWTFTGLHVEEELRSRAGYLSEADIMSTEQSWDLVNHARLLGQDWLSVANEIDTKQIKSMLDDCDFMLHQDFVNIRRDKTNENNDRVDFQIKSAEKRKQRELATLQTILERYQQRGQKRMIAPTEGRIRKVQERFDIQREKFNQRREMKSSENDVCRGVIRLF